MSSSGNHLKKPALKSGLVVKQNELQVEPIHKQQKKSASSRARSSIKCLEDEFANNPSFTSMVKTYQNEQHPSVSAAYSKENGNKLNREESEPNIQRDLTQNITLRINGELEQNVNSTLNKSEGVLSDGEMVNTTGLKISSSQSNLQRKRKKSLSTKQSKKTASVESSPHLPANIQQNNTSKEDSTSKKSSSEQNLEGRLQQQIDPLLKDKQAASQPPPGIPQIQKQASQEEEGSFAIFRCPLELEKYNSKLWIVYLDNLIEVIFKLPVEIVRLVLSYLVFGHKIQRKDYHLVVHFCLVAVPLLIFTANTWLFEFSEYLEVSYLYHSFRGQSTLKLYGVLMTADVVDKMLCTVGEYLLLDVLWQKLAKSSPLHLIKYLLPAILYVIAHSLVLYLSIVGYNVILNSEISSLFVLIFVHNSMKLKSSIFKKFTKDGYTQQTHVDLRTRFSKCLYVFLIWASMSGFASDIIRKLLYFLGAEVIVEWIKHIFLMLLNNLKLSIIESMNKASKYFVAQVRIIPAFQPQEIVNHKAEQTFLERENYLAQTLYITPSLKVGFRINFIAFHHAVVILKILYPLAIQNFSITNIGVAILTLRACQIVIDVLTLLFSFNNDEILKLFILKNASFIKTLFSPRDIVLLPICFLSLLFKYYQ